MLSPAALIERFRTCAHIVDGALATELQARGVNINGPLWSGNALLNQPEAIEQLHHDYLQAGADVLITASYQVSIQGMADAGYTENEAEETLRRSVRLAANARQAFLNQHRTPNAEHRTPLIAASIGPYGAFTADGGEYHGNYDISPSALLAFHQRRFEVLAESEADLIAFETTPCLEEARVYAKLLNRWADTPAWISFSCRDGQHTCHGEHIADCARELDSLPNVVAIGVNCTAPQHVSSLLRYLKVGTDKPIVVYPNSGEHWDADGHCFAGNSHADELAAAAPEWVKAGARLIGGCCRTGPHQIAELKAALAVDPD
jgi:homocysteine S-methyltransferase